jgi:hypothetical protein
MNAGNFRGGTHEFKAGQHSQKCCSPGAVNLHARLTHSGIELHPIYDPRNARTIQYISGS